MREINKIIIHCSDSTWGDVSEVDKWHKERGWSEIGYHYVVLNGHRGYKSDFRSRDNGYVEQGRDERKKGAHCKGHNADSIGICLIGKQHFTQRQIESLRILIEKLLQRHNIERDGVYGHYEFSIKTCPNMTKEFIMQGVM